MHISETEVAFTVHKPGDPVPATVRGTVFHTEKFDPNQQRAVLLLHGGTLDRRFWDGFKIPGALRFAAELACQSDTAVFTVDRLGYGESPYRGHLARLPPAQKRREDGERDVEMAQER